MAWWSDHTWIACPDSVPEPMTLWCFNKSPTLTLNKATFPVFDDFPARFVAAPRLSQFSTMILIPSLFKRISPDVASACRAGGWSDWLENSSKQFVGGGDPLQGQSAVPVRRMRVCLRVCVVVAVPSSELVDGVDNAVVMSGLTLFQMWLWLTLNIFDVRHRSSNSSSSS